EGGPSSVRGKGECPARHLFRDSDAVALPSRACAPAPQGAVVAEADQRLAVRGEGQGRYVRPMALATVQVLSGPHTEGADETAGLDGDQTVSIRVKEILE